MAYLEVTLGGTSLQTLHLQKLQIVMVPLQAPVFGLKAMSFVQLTFLLSSYCLNYVTRLTLLLHS